MFQRIHQILGLFDAGVLSERGLAMVLEHETREKSRLPASRRS